MDNNNDTNVLPTAEDLRLQQIIAAALAAQKEQSDRELLTLHRQLQEARNGNYKIADKLFNGIPTFDGERNLGALGNFLRKVEEWMEESKDEERGQVKLVKSKLGPHAASVVAGCTTWAGLKKQLKSSLTHANQGHHVRDQLLDLRVENGIREYTKAFNEVLQTLQPDDVDRDTVIWLYVKGLPDDIRKWIDFSLGKRELSTLKAVQDLSINQEKRSTGPDVHSASELMTANVMKQAR